MDRRELSDDPSKAEVDELGPVDWIVVEFPAASSTARSHRRLHLVERGMVRVLDLLIVKKDEDGTLEAFEIGDLDHTELGELRKYEASWPCC